WMGLLTEPAPGLIDEAEFVIVNANRADRAFAEVENFMARGWAFAGESGYLVIAIEVVLVGPVTNGFALQQLIGDVWITGCGHEGGQPVQARENAVLYGVRRDMTGPASDRGHAEAAFEDGSLGLREWRLTAIGPGKHFGAVVGGEHDDGVVVLTHVFQLVHHDADVVVHLGHAGFFFRPTVLSVAHRFILRGEVSDDVHTG